MHIIRLPKPVSGALWINLDQAAWIETMGRGVRIVFGPIAARSDETVWHELYLEGDTAAHLLDYLRHLTAEQ